METRLPTPLDCAELHKHWPKWKHEFLIYLIANNKMTEPENNKIAIFLWLVGPRGVEIFNTLFPNDGDVESMFGNTQPHVTNEQGSAQRTLKSVLEAFDAYCLPKKNLAMETFKFNMIIQKEKQSFAEFETAIRTQVQYCELKCEYCQSSYAHRMLRDRIVIGVADKKLQLKLLDGKEEPLTKIIDTCKIFEAASANKLLLEKNEKASEVNLIEAKNKIETESEKIDVIRQSCFKCGQPYNFKHLRSFPAKNVKCKLCGILGHFAKCCKKESGQQSGRVVHTSGQQSGTYGQLDG